MKTNKTDSISSFNYDSLKDIRERIDDLIKQYGEDATLNVESVTSYGDTSIEWSISYSREETDKEKSKRIEAEEKQKAAIEKHELDLLNKLQKKYSK
jgi:hypothetical protein